jgi:cell wall-associated NlpC family hydrolase
MRWLRRRLFDSATRALTRRRSHYHRLLPSHLGSLRTTLHAGDVLLVDGDQRVSEVIKYLTQSSWSHAAMYVGDELWRRHPEQRADLEARFGVDARHLLVEALMEEGVVASPLAKYDGHNLRVCRPHGLRPADCRHVIEEILDQLGSRYAVGNALALARYFFPVSLIPRRWRRRALELGDDVTKEVICSTLIARAFQRVGFPILPAVTPGAIEAARRRWRDWIKPGPYPHVFHREPCALITPRDFDLSPYFDVVKLTGLADREIDYRRIRWA